MAEDVIREITFPSYPKDVLLNAFRGKDEDERYSAVKRQWRTLFLSPSFRGCAFSVNRESRIHYVTLTPSTRCPESWQLTHYDKEGPYCHVSYSDTNREAGHKMRELVCELARYSADRDISARIHFSAEKERGNV